MIFLECIGSRASLSATEDKGVNESLRLFVFIVRTGLPGTRIKTKRDMAKPPLSECCRGAAGRQGKNTVNPRVGVISGFFVRISCQGFRFCEDPAGRQGKSEYLRANPFL